MVSATVGFNLKFCQSWFVFFFGTLSHTMILFSFVVFLILHLVFQQHLQLSVTLVTEICGKSICMAVLAHQHPSSIMLCHYVKRRGAIVFKRVSII